LLLQIEELKNLGCNAGYVQYLTAYYNIDLHQYEKARQLLVSLLAETRYYPSLAVSINLLLARCYSAMGETQMQQDAYGRALNSNPGNVIAKLGYINTQVQQGDLDGAIEGYRTIVEQFPQVRTKLAWLLITRNRQRPAAEHDWNKVADLVAAAAKAAPESV